MQEAEAAASASAAELADIRAKATFILSHLQQPVSDDVNSAEEPLMMQCYLQCYLQCTMCRPWSVRKSAG
jgi:hypothetical protein